MSKIFIWMLLLNIFSKLLGFLREIFLAYFGGVTYVTDAYYMAALIPEAIFVFISEGLIVSYIPTATELIKKNELDKFTSNFLNILLMITSGIFIIGEWQIGKITNLFVSGFKEEAMTLVVSFSRITFIGIFFILFFHIFSNYLQINGKFIAIPISNVLFGIFNIIGIYLAYRYTKLLFLPISLVVALCSKMIVISYFLKKLKYRYSFKINFGDNRVKNILRLSIPIILGLSVDRINRIVDRNIASKIEVGGISSLTYAGVISRIPIELITHTLILLIFPLLVKFIIEKNFLQLEKTIERIFIQLSIFLIPMTIGFMIFGEGIIKLVYQRGNFRLEDTLIANRTLCGYSLGIFTTSVRDVICRVFYSFKDTKTPLYNAVLGAVINIILNIILSKYLGIAGIAYATSISSIITAIILFYSLKKFRISFHKKVLKKISIILNISVIAILSSYFLDKLLIISYPFKKYLIFPIFLSIIIYFILLYFFRIEEYFYILDEIKLVYKK